MLYIKIGIQLEWHLNDLLGINFHNDIIFQFRFNVLRFNPVSPRVTRNHKGKEDALTTWNTIDITDMIYAVVRMLYYMVIYYVVLIE